MAIEMVFKKRIQPRKEKVSAAAAGVVSGDLQKKGFITLKFDMKAVNQNISKWPDDLSCDKRSFVAIKPGIMRLQTPSADGGF